MKINIEKIKFRIKITGKDGWKAIVVVDFGDLNIKGFRIRESEHLGSHGEYLWVVPPSYISKGGGYKPTIHIKKNIWEEIQKKMLKEYHKVLNEEAEERLSGGQSERPIEEDIFANF